MAPRPANPCSKVEILAEETLVSRLSENALIGWSAFGRTGRQISEIGYGMWGLAGWTGSDDEETQCALQRAVELGVNFFDTAWAYGEGRSEKILGDLVRAHPSRKLYAASKIPAKNFKWPARAENTLDECYPPDHIRRYTEWSLQNLGLPSLDLM